MKLNYALVAIKKTDLERIQSIPHKELSVADYDGIKFYHAVMFEEMPTFFSYMSVYNELKQDPEFGLQDEELIVLPATDDFLKELQNDLQDELEGE